MKNYQKINPEQPYDASRISKEIAPLLHEHLTDIIFVRIPKTDRYEAYAPSENPHKIQAIPGGFNFVGASNLNDLGNIVDREFSEIRAYRRRLPKEIRVVSAHQGVGLAGWGVFFKE